MKSIKKQRVLNTVQNVQKLAFGIKKTIKKTSHKKKIIKQKTKS
jgi:hypothetical protein